LALEADSAGSRWQALAQRAKISHGSTGKRKRVPGGKKPVIPLPVTLRQTRARMQSSLSAATPAGLLGNMLTLCFASFAWRGNSLCSAHA
jgi:hypothetical protein